VYVTPDGFPEGEFIIRQVVRPGSFADNAGKLREVDVADTRKQVVFNLEVKAAQVPG
jgi:hypothetical protein